MPMQARGGRGEHLQSATRPGHSRYAVIFAVPIGISGQIKGKVYLPNCRTGPFIERDNVLHVVTVDGEDQKIAVQNR